jgi:hypothetical protein
MPNLFTMPDAPTICMATHSGNASAHLGLVVAPMKRTWDDRKSKKEVAKEKKQAKEEKQRAAVHKVVSLEKHMVEEEDTTNIMPKPRGKNGNQLHRTIGYAQIPLTDKNVSDSNYSANDTDGGGTQDRDTEPNMTDKEAPPKKKKSGFHDAVRQYLDDDPNLEYGCQRSDDVEIIQSGSNIDALYEVVVSCQAKFETRHQLTQRS